MPAAGPGLLPPPPSLAARALLAHFTPASSYISIDLRAGAFLQVRASSELPTQTLQEDLNEKTAARLQGGWIQ